MLAVISEPTAEGPRVRQDGTTILFGLPGVRVRHVERDEDGTRVVHVVTDDEGAAACPQCGVFSSTVRQRRRTRPRDPPYGEASLAVRWHKVQYACREKRCPRKAFTEQIAELPAGARLTGRLRRSVAQRIGEGLAVSVAGEGLMSWPIAHAAFVTHAKQLLAEPEPVRVLGIDETRRGRPRLGQCEVTGRWVKLERFETNFATSTARKACWVRHLAVARPT
jgi:transposase